MYNFKPPQQKMLTSIVFALSLCCGTNVFAKQPTIWAAAGSSVTFMEIGDPMFDFSGRLELEVFRLTSQKPSKSALVFEVIGMQVPYPGMRRYAIEPSFGTTTALFPKGNDFLWGFRTGMRLHLVDVSGSSMQLRLTAGLCQTRNGMQFGGDHLMPRNPFYFYPAVVLNLHRNFFVSLGTFLTELRVPQSSVTPIEIGFKIL